MIDFIEFLCSFIGILALPQTDTHLHKQHDELLGKHDKYPPNTSMCHHFSIIYMYVRVRVHIALHTLSIPYPFVWRKMTKIRTPCKSRQKINRFFNFTTLDQYDLCILVFLWIWGFVLKFLFFLPHTIYAHLHTWLFQRSVQTFYITSRMMPSPLLPLQLLNQWKRNAHYVILLK